MAYIVRIKHENGTESVAPLWSGDYFGEVKHIKKINKDIVSVEIISKDPDKSFCEYIDKKRVIEYDLPKDFRFNFNQLRKID